MSEKKDVQATREPEATRKLKDEELEKVIGGVKIAKPKTY